MQRDKQLFEAMYVKENMLNHVTEYIQSIHQTEVVQVRHSPNRICARLIVPATYVQLRYFTKYFGVKNYNRAVKWGIGQIIKK
jgi:hypothetical protein